MNKSEDRQHTEGELKRVKLRAWRRRVKKARPDSQDVIAMRADKNSMDD